MAIRIVVAVTDNAWHAQLRNEPDLQEVNFWSPSGIEFRSLRPGELFLFKAKSPVNKIVGGGIFAHSTIVPCSVAWQAFGRANGASTFAEMRNRIARLKAGSAARQAEDFRIGCRIVTQPFFFDEQDYIDPPPSWKPSIVRHKTYSSTTTEGFQLWTAVQTALRHHASSRTAESLAAYGDPQLVHPRLGQGAFRLKVTDVYHRKCAVTGERTLPALDAAHIKPYSDGGQHDASNGLLLRSDIHRLYDSGYVSVSPDFRFEVSESIREEFENGRQYYQLQGTDIYVPEYASERPDRDALDWHYSNVFRQ